MSSSSIPTRHLLPKSNPIGWYSIHPYQSHAFLFSFKKAPPDVRFSPLTQPSATIPFTPFIPIHKKRTHKEQNTGIEKKKNVKDKDYWYSIPNFNKCAYRMAHNFEQAQAAREGSTWIPCSNFRRRAMTWQEYKLISRVWCQMGSGASYKPNMSPNTNHLNTQRFSLLGISKRVTLQPLKLSLKMYGPTPHLTTSREFVSDKK